MGSVPGSPQASSFIGPISYRVSSFLHALQSPVAGYRAKRDEEGGVGADALGLLCGQRLPLPANPAHVDAGPSNKMPIQAATFGPSFGGPHLPGNVGSSGDGQAQAPLTSASPAAPILALVRLRAVPDDPHVSASVPAFRRRQCSMASEIASASCLSRSLMRWLPCTPSVARPCRRCGSNSSCESDDASNSAECNSTTSVQGASGVLNILDDEVLDEQEDDATDMDIGVDANRDAAKNREALHRGVAMATLCGLRICRRRSGHSSRWRSDVAVMMATGTGARCCSWTVEAVSAVPHVGCSCPEEYAELLRRLIVSERSLRKAIQNAARAALSGKLFEATVLLLCGSSATGGGVHPHASGASWRGLPYVQIQTCLLPSTTAGAASLRASVDSLPKGPSMPRRSEIAAEGVDRKGYAYGLRIVHCAAPMQSAAAAAAAAAAGVPLGGDVALAVAMAAAAQQTTLSVKALAADMAQGMITVIDYATGAILYQNRNSEVYMGEAPPPEVMIAVEAREQQVLLQQQQQEQQDSASNVSQSQGARGGMVAGVGDPGPGLFRVPFVLRELLRHEPGALERLQACLKAGEEFEETVQVPATLGPILTSLRVSIEPPNPSSADPPTAAVTGSASATAMADKARALGSLVRGTRALANGNVDAATIAPHAQQAAAWLMNNGSSRSFRKQQQQQQQKRRQTVPSARQVQSSIYNGSSGGAQSLAAGAVTLASSALGYHGLASRICSGTSRLGRMTLPEDLPSGSGVRPVAHMQGPTMISPTSPPLPLPHSGVDAEAEFLAGSNGAASGPMAKQLPVVEADAIPGLAPRLATPPLLSIPSRTLLACTLGASTPGAFQLAKPAIATPPLPFPPATVLSAYAPGIAAGAITSGSESSQRDGGQSSLTSLARRVTRLLGRANTFGVGSAGSQRSGGSATAAAASGNTSPLLCLGQARSQRAQTPKAGAAAMPAPPLPDPGGVALPEDGICLGFGEAEELERETEEVTPDGRVSSRSMPPKELLFTATAVSAAAQETGGVLSGTISDGLLWTLMRMRGPRDTRRQSHQLPSPLLQPQLSPAPAQDQSGAGCTRSVTGRASTGSCSLSQRRINLSQVNDGRAATTSSAAARSRVGKRWSIGANPRLSVYESAPAAAGATSPAAAAMASTAATFGGFTRGNTLGINATQAAIAFGFGVGKPGGGLPIPGSLPLPTPSQRRYGASSPRAPPQGILVPSRRPAPIPSATSGVVVGSTATGSSNGGFFSGLAGSVSVLDGSVGAVGSLGPSAPAGGRTDRASGGATGGVGSELQVAGRTNSIIQAIMSLPERSHLFNRRRQTSGPRPFAGGGAGTSSTFPRCSLDLRAGSTSGRCLPGRVASAAPAMAVTPNTYGGVIGGGSSHDHPPCYGATMRRTSCGEGPAEADSTYNMYGGGGGGGGGAVTGDMSDLEASPYALRIDSVTALKATRMRRTLPRRASSQSSLLHLTSAAAAATATGTCVTDQPGCCSGANTKVAAVLTSAALAGPASSGAAATASTPATRSDGTTGADVAMPSAEEAARRRGSTGSIPTARQRELVVRGTRDSVDTTGGEGGPTGDNAIDVAIAAADSGCPRTDAGNGALTSSPVASASATSFPVTMEICPALTTAAKEVAAACLRYVEGGDGGDMTYVEGEKWARRETGASLHSDATVHELLVGLQALKDDVQSLHSGPHSNSLIGKVVTSGGGIGSSGGAFADPDASPWLTSAVDSVAFQQLGIPKGSIGAVATVAGPTAMAAGPTTATSQSLQRPGSRGGAPMSLLSLQLRHYGSSSSNCGGSGGAPGIRRLAETVASPFTVDAGPLSTATVVAATNTANRAPEEEAGSGAKLVNTPCMSVRLEQFLPSPPSILAPQATMLDAVGNCTEADTAESTPDATILMATALNEGPKAVLGDPQELVEHVGGGFTTDNAIIICNAAGEGFNSADISGEPAAGSAWLGTTTNDGAAGMPSVTSIVAAAATMLMGTAQKPPRASVRICGGASGGGSLNFLNAKASSSGTVRVKGETTAADGASHVHVGGGSGSTEPCPGRNLRNSRSSNGGGGAIGTTAAEGRRSILDTLSLEMTRLGVTGKPTLDHEREGADHLMRSGSYTAGAPTPAFTGRPTPAPRRQINRQSTHDRIEQLLEIARNTGSTCEQQPDGAGAGACGGRSTPGTASGVPGAGACGAGGGSTGAGASAVVPVWHSVHVCVCSNPATGVPVMVVTQYDVTRQMDARSQLTMLLEREQKILESIFPRHVIEYLTMQHRAADVGPRVNRISAGGRMPHRISSGDAGGSQQSQPQEQQQQQPSASATAGGLVGASGSSTAGGLLAHYRSSAAQLACVATAHPCVTILFADIVGFTSMSKQVTPLEVMTFLNQLYSRFDDMLDIYKVYKVETIGDCFMAAGGLVAQDEEGWRTTITHDNLHAVRVLTFAKAMLREARKVQMPTGGPVLMRVGIHSGPVMSGVVGSRMPRFCLFGDTVNTASRMESTSRPGRIHVSADTHALLPNERWEPTGGVQVKGKGIMATYLWASDAVEEKGEQLHRVLGVYL
ncbi:hypothetical protein VaNZ11_005249 [Volvox africanus]|uniref:Guanylate cyclase domain-containing protein n=1 Tax=Volvox africanus TaxID=51714 RepID=A0ABQ5RYB8_9CHLO|nr:hypothetical protein VaNZ11_005249 [Volvox africanus]